MRAFFLIQGSEVAASRYRVLQYFPGLEARGIACEARPFPRSWASWPEVMAAAERADVLFLQRKQLGHLVCTALRRAARRIVYDFDDALWIKSARHPDNRSCTRRLRFARMAALADAVVAGNRFLAEHTRHHNEAVMVIPSPIDTDGYVTRDYPGAGGTPEAPFTVGWIGAHGSIHYLERLRTALEELHRIEPRARLKVICDRFPEGWAIPVEEARWSAATELAELRSLDVGIMPLLEDDWSRGKCGLKALQYLACGVPVVCTPIGINEEIVTEGVEGFGARTPAEWVARLLALARDPGMRRRTGLAGRRTVEERFSLRACLPRMEEVLRG